MSKPYRPPRCVIAFCHAAVTAAALAALPTGCQYAATGYNISGVHSYTQGDFVAARDQFAKAIQANPENADGYYNLAALFHQYGKRSSDSSMLTQAESYYNECLDRDKNHLDCRRGLAALLVDTNRSELAFKMLKNWTGETPDSAEPRVELARLYEEFGDREAAIDQLNMAAQIDADNPRVFTALAKIREDNGDYRQALDNYQRSLSLNPFQPAVTQRVAALQSGMRLSGSLPTFGNTRTVTAPMPPQVQR